MTRIPNTSLHPNDNSYYENDDIVFINNMQYRLGDVIGHGGQGTVFKIKGSKELVAKLYHRNCLNLQQQEKLKIITSLRINSKELIAPINLVLDSKKEIIGYTMEYIDGSNLSTTLLAGGKEYTKRDIVQLALNIVKAYHKLDSTPFHKVLAGDINPFNIIVYDKTKVRLIDLDSIQVDDFPCPVGFPGYSHPSAIGKNYKEFLRTINNEQFALSVLLFFVLIFKHPFAQKGGQDDDYNVKNLPFRYTLDKAKVPIVGIPHPYIYRWNTLTNEIQQLFIDIFSLSKSVTFEQWEKELSDYGKTLDIEVKKNSLLDIWLLNVDPFSSARACPYCGQPFTPKANQILCDNCSKLNLVERKCANTYCSTPDKVYFIPSNKSSGVKYCSDCLSPTINYCKSCGSIINTYKYATHTFDAQYCNYHRGPAKGRFTKARKKVEAQLFELARIFKDGVYSSLVIEEALKAFREVLNVIKQDEDIEEVDNEIDTVKSYIRGLELYKVDYKNWLDKLKATNVPTSSIQLSAQITDLQNIYVSFDTLSKKWQNTNIRFKNTFGSKYFYDLFSKRIDELKKIRFSKCACCGKEERDDNNESVFYCSDCKKVYTFSCQHCGDKYIRAKYLYEKNIDGKLCPKCVKESDDICEIISKTKAKDFEVMDSFEALNFTSRYNHFNQIYNYVTSVSNSYKKKEIAFVQYDKFKEQYELVKAETRIFEKHRQYICALEADDLKKKSYTELCGILSKLTDIEMQLTSKNKLSSDYNFTVADLAPTPLALKSISDISQKVKNQRKEKELQFEKILSEFNEDKIKLATFDGYSIDWNERRSSIQKISEKYKTPFEDYSVNQYVAQNGLQYIKSFLPWIIENEEDFYKLPLKTLSYYGSLEYSLNDKEVLKKGISELTKLEDCLKEKGKSFILNEAFVKKIIDLRGKLELLESIIDKSFFYGCDNYCEKPIHDWNKDMIYLLTSQNIKIEIPNEFLTVVCDYRDGKIEVLEKHKKIEKDIGVYLLLLKNNFKSSYNERYLTGEIQQHINSLAETGYDVNYLNGKLADACQKESQFKDEYIDSLNKQTFKFKKRAANHLATALFNVVIIINLLVDFNTTKMQVNTYFRLRLIGAGLIVIYSIMSFFIFIKTKEKNLNLVNEILEISISLVIGYYLPTTFQYFCLVSASLCSKWVWGEFLKQKKLLRLDDLDREILKEDFI